jgi:HAD superfamily hydrolase (TIGR01509 family)
VITTLIFDMNGVITDDEHIHELATKEAFSDIGIKLTAEDYRAFCLGRTDVAAFKDLFKKFDIPHQNTRDLIVKKSLRYQELIKENLKIYPGIVNFIKNQSTKYTLALASSSTYDEVTGVVNLLNIKDYFKVIITANDVKHGKPHPEPYLLTAKKINVNPTECLVLEDSENGVLSAIAAGMICVAITNTEVEKNLIKAHYRIKKLESLQSILDGI